MAKFFAKKFYKSKAWTNTRNAYVLERTSIDGGMCEQCKENVGQELHHKIHLSPVNIEDYDICLNPDNLVYLCKDCHFKAHREVILEQLDRRRQNQKNILTNGCYLDVNGDLIKMQKNIVWGAPASGKMAYVNSKMQSGDLIVSLENIKYSISLEKGMDKAYNLSSIALSIQESLYKLIESNQVDCKVIWIISCLPKKKEREALSERLGANLIHIKTDYNECIKRVGSDGNGVDKELQRAMIDKYFGQLEL